MIASSPPRSGSNAGGWVRSTTGHVTGRSSPASPPRSCVPAGSSTSQAVRTETSGTLAAEPTSVVLGRRAQAQSYGRPRRRRDGRGERATARRVCAPRTVLARDWHLRRVLFPVRVDVRLPTLADFTAQDVRDLDRAAGEARLVDCLDQA